MSCSCTDGVTFPRAKSYAGKAAQENAGYLGDSATSMGSALASRVSKSARTWFGSGDYTINKNSLILGDGDLVTRNFKNETRVMYKEYLGDIFTHPTTAGAFNITSYSVNPGDVTCFPWLSSIANQFDQWTPNGIIFEFKSTASDSTTSSATGSVVAAAEYDLTEAVYTSKAEMLNAAYSQESKISDDLRHGIECDAAQNPQSIFYTRTFGANIPTGGSIRDYDLCRFSIATIGGSIPAGTNIGSLYIHYDVTFRKEQIYGGLQSRGTLWSVWQNMLPGSIGTTDSLPTLIGNATLVAGRNMGITLSTTPSITIPKNLAGVAFRLLVEVENSAAAIPYASNWTITYTNATSIAKTFYRSPDSTSPFRPSVFSDTALLTQRQQLSVWYFKIDNAINTDCVLTFNGMNTGANVDACVLIELCQIPDTGLILA